MCVCVLGARGVFSSVLCPQPKRSGTMTVRVDSSRWIDCTPITTGFRLSEVLALKFCANQALSGYYSIAFDDNLSFLNDTEDRSVQQSNLRI